MLFQYFPYYGGYSQNVFQVLETWGILDAILPFVLIFVLVFAVLQKINLFGRWELNVPGDPSKGYKPQTTANKKINAAIAFALSLMVVIPHVLGRYPPASDPIIILSQFLPQAVVLLVGVLMVFLLLGLGGYNENDIKSGKLSWIAFGATIVLGFVIVVSIFPSIVANNFLSDPTIQALLIILSVFGLVVWLVTRHDKT